MSAQRVVVIGGGIIGCTIAWRLAQRGTRVVVVEKSQPVTKASWAAAGMLLPIVENDSPLDSLAAASFAEYPAFVQELREATGIDAELIVEGAQSGSVDNRKLGRALHTVAAATGVEFRLQTAARSIMARHTQCERVELATGESIEADAIVIAAGAWSGEILGLPMRLPVVPVRGQMLAVEQAPPITDRIVKGDRCYLVPRGSRLLIGATVERVGFDETTTESGINGLLECARAMAAAIAHARVLETWAGLRPGTPDDLPILGADPHVHGLFYATGHYRNGILLAPVTGRVLAELVTGATSSIDLTPFSISRFIVDVDDPRCDLCGAPMKEWHCRIICTGCGYQRDCSDP